MQYSDPYTSYHLGVERKLKTAKKKKKREKKKGKRVSAACPKRNSFKAVFQKKIQVCNAICYFYEDLREINFLSQETGNRKY